MAVVPATYSSHPAGAEGPPNLPSVTTGLVHCLPGRRSWHSAYSIRLVFMSWCPSSPGQ